MTNKQFQEYRVQMMLNDVSKQTVYISGKMTGLPDYNRSGFEKIELTLTLLGYNAINPLKLFCITEKKRYKEYLRKDLTVMLQCDAVFVMDNWKNSKGAIIEVVNAWMFDLPVYSIVINDLEEIMISNKPLLPDLVIIELFFEFSKKLILNP